MNDDQFPQRIQVNAWSGENVTGNLDPNAANWGVKKQRETPERQLAAAEPADLRDWQNERIGWGVVLPENEELDPKQAAIAADAPEPIRALVEIRNHAPVFRYRAELHNLKLRRYYSDGGARDIAITGGERGVGPKALPWYLMIYGSPQTVPWALQYNLHQSCFVGRLDLVGEALENYVNALVNDWRDSASRPDQPLVWSVNHGHPDITWLMHGAIAKPLSVALSTDAAIGDKVCFLSDQQATIAGLQERLVDRSPALVVTTSHGMTGPLNDAAMMNQRLGLLVDVQHDLLQPGDLLTHWQPDGAIWYAHACCSAGGDSSTSYEGLVEANSSVPQILHGVAALGAQIAPLPKVLLGAKKPLRAFIGQVEPTFDWTLRAETGQVLTDTLCKAIYQHMHRAKPEPVGMAFRAVHHHAGELFAQLDNLRRQVARAEAGAQVAATRTHLAALDRQSMVILGDPTVALPPLPN